MKKIAILSNYYKTFKIRDDCIEPFTVCADYFHDAWMDLKRVSIHSFDCERWVFRDSVDSDENWNFTLYQWDYRPDIIWNRSWNWIMYTYEMCLKHNIPIFPEKRFMCIESSKYEMYLFLWEYQPPTILLSDFFECPDDFSVWWKILVKPLYWSSGKGIEKFESKDELLRIRDKFVWLEWVHLVQEFKDFTQWIPWLIDGMHDLRIAYIGGKISHATIRSPMQWSFKSNIGSWGTEIWVPIEKIPEEVCRICDAVLNKMKFSPINCFSIDYGYVLKENRWYIFEINSSPGMMFWSEDPQMKNAFYHAYFTDMVEMIRKL